MAGRGGTASLGAPVATLPHTARTRRRLRASTPYPGSGGDPDADDPFGVFVSSTLGELAGERAVVLGAIERLRLISVMLGRGHGRTRRVPSTAPICSRATSSSASTGSATGESPPASRCPGLRTSTGWRSGGCPSSSTSGSRSAAGRPRWRSSCGGSRKHHRLAYRRSPAATKSSTGWCRTTSRCCSASASARAGTRRRRRRRSPRASLRPRPGRPRAAAWPPTAPA